MPIYEYRCRKGHDFEVMQSMGDEPVTTCRECGAPVDRVFRPVAVHFKGSGFYTTDYGRKRSGASAGESDGAKPESKESKESKDSKETTSKAPDASKND